MFTGIIQARGEIRELRATAQDRDLVVAAPPALVSRLEVGASVAIDGVCQTVTSLGADRFEVHAIFETLRVTTLGDLRVGSRVNLEAALAAGEALGGHFVQGHVDAVARIVEVRTVGESITYRFQADPEWVGQLVPKGSVAIDGISLTVGPRVDADHFEVYLIPHTVSVTTLGEKKSGDRVNLETDILGKYVQRYLGLGDSMTLERLGQAGYGVDAGSGGEEG